MRRLPKRSSLVVYYLADCPQTVSTVAAWLHEEWFARMNFSLTEVEECLASRQRRDGPPVTFVALENGLPVGTASLVREASPDAVGELDCLTGVYVVPECRGRGIGSLLCRRVAAEAQALGLRSLSAFTPDREAFYARLGWEKEVDTLVSVGGVYQIVAWMKWECTNATPVAADTVSAK